MTNVEALKPCPFCGGGAEMIHPMGNWSKRGYGPDGSRVVCGSVKCAAMTPVFYGADQDGEATSSWNRRAALSSAPVAGGEEVVAFLIERLVAPGYGPARSIVDAAKYDPTQDSFWVGDAKSRHLVTPLYPAPPTTELDAENARLRADRDDFKDEWQAELEKRKEVQARLRATEATPPAPKVTDDMVEAGHTAMMSELFLVCQPDRGDVFSFMDDRPELIQIALTAAQEAGE